MSRKGITLIGINEDPGDFITKSEPENLHYSDIPIVYYDGGNKDLDNFLNNSKFYDLGFVFQVWSLDNAILFVLVKGKDAHQYQLGYADFIYGVNRSRILSVENLETKQFEFLDTNYLINNLKKGIGGGGLLFQEATKLIGKASEKARGLKTQMLNGQSFRLKFLNEDKEKEYIDVYTNKENSEFLELFLKVNFDKELTETAKSQKEGCFIATACYGNYNSPEVLEFRKFRDNILIKSLVGKYFIKVYYRISPKLVKLIGTENDLTENIKKLILNPLLKIITRNDK